MKIDEKFLHEGSPLQGLSEARRGKKVFSIFDQVNRRGGVPSGAAAFITIINYGLTRYPNNRIFSLDGMSSETG